MAKLLSGTRIYGTGTVDSQLFVNGNTSATSITSGALQVTGGAGIGGDLWLGGGNINVVKSSTNLILGESNLTSTGTTNIVLGRSLAGDAAAIKTYAGTGTNLKILNNVAGYHFDLASYATNGWGPSGTNDGVRIRIDGATGDVKIINTTAATAVGTGALQVAGGVSVGGNLYVSGTVNATVVGITSTATNLSGGTTGQLPYQNAPGVTQFAGPGTAGQLLVSAGATSTGPVFTNTSSIQVGYANNILNGTVGQIVFQSNTSTTSFVVAGTAGQLLVSAGTSTSGPVFTNTSSIQVGYASNILGGSIGSILYQSNISVTTSLAPSTAGYILQTNGTGQAPTWVSTGSFVAGTAAKLSPGRYINGTLFDGTADITPTEWYHSIRDFTNGTLITTSIDYSVANGDPFVLQIRGNSYGSAMPFDTQIQGYIYNSTIINTGGYSVGPSFPIIAMNVGGALCFWFARQTYWQGFNVHVYTALSTRAVNKIVSITDVVQPAGGTKLVTITPAQVLRSDNIGSYTAGSAALTSTYVGFGSAGGALTGSSALTWDGAKLSLSSGALATTAGTQIVSQRFTVTDTNTDNLEISNIRGTAGADWSTAGWRIQSKIDSTWMGYIQFNGTPSGANNYGISFGTGSSTSSANSISERMRIDSSGNVGIGTSSPGARLNVVTAETKTQNATVALFATSTLGSNDFQLILSRTANTSYALQSVEQGVAYRDLILQPNGANVGIGISTPAVSLDVAGRGRFLQNVAASSGAIVLRQSASDTEGAFIQWVNNANNVEKGWLHVDTSSNMKFATVSTERMRITSNGGLSFAGASNFGTAGQFLQSNGDAAPTWVNSSTITVGSTLGGSNNYATSIGWIISSNAAQTGYYGGNFNTNGDGNLITYATDPFGRRSVVWQTRNNDATSDADGGWDKTITGLNSAKSYMSVVYIIRRGTSTSGNFYHGCDGGNTLNLNGSANTNPYFSATGISTLPQDVWCVSIGFIQAYGDSSSANTARGGIYRMDTGQLVSGSTDYKMASGSTQQTHRTYLYYSTDAASSLDWWGPGFYEINGNEPNLEQLLGSNNAGWRKNWYAPKYYDSDNINYYVKPSSLSVISSLLINLTSSKTYGGTLQTVGGIIDFGSSASASSIVAAYDYNAADASPTYASAVVRKFGPSASGTLYAVGSIAAAGWAEIAGINVSGVAYGTNGSAPVVFGTTGVERLRITADGNVGIGTTPSIKLEVQNSGAQNVAWFKNFSGTRASPTENADWPWPVLALTGYGNFYLQTMLSFTLPNDASGQTNGVYHTDNSVWNFRLNGVTASGWDNNSDTTPVTVSSANVGLQLLGPGNLRLGTDGAKNIYFRTSGSDKVTIDSNGNVGIGYTSPSAYGASLTIQRSGQSSIMLWNAGIASGQIGVAASGSNFKLYNTYSDGTLANGKGIDIDSSGKVGIGINPSYTLDVAGSIYSTQGLADQTGYNSSLRLVNPGGASSWAGVSTQTGAIKIKLPQVAPGNTMLRMTVKVYTYDGQSFTIECGGYTYSGPTWYNTFAHMSTQSRGMLNVRFGNDGSTFCIYIGELGSTWSYPNVFVTDFQAGYSAYSASTWNTGWSVSYEASAFGNVTSTQVVYTQIINQAGNRYSTDVNSLLRTGFYNVEGQPTNSPVNYGQIIVAQGIDTGLQIAGGYANDQLYFRGWASSGSTFYSWRTVLHSGNYSSYALPIGGGTMTGVLATRTNYGGGYVGSNDTTLSVRGVVGAHGAFMSFHIPGQFATNVGIDYIDNIFKIGGWSNGGTYVGVYAGQLLATSDVLAYYSDNRLKTNLGNITGALAAITKLNGFRYINNELAETFGYTDKNVQLGVSAQEVESLFPEIVAIAPFDRGNDLKTKEITSKSGENYLTVKYEKLTPVLIEAIKEQQVLIESQQKEIDQIKKIIADQQKQIDQLLLNSK